MKTFVQGFIRTALCATAFSATSALAATSAPQSMAVSIGTYNGVASSLAAASEGKIVNLYTNRNGNLNVTFKYSASALGSGIQLSGLLRQYTSSNVFKFQTLNSAGTWMNVGSISGGTSYKSVLLSLPAGSVVNGAITLRLVSSVGADDLDVDQLVLVDSGTAAVPAPSPTPTPSAPVVAPSPTPTPLAPVASPTPTPAPISTSTGVKIPAGTSYLLQLQGTINTSIAAKVYDIDMYDNSASLFASLKASGHIVICYFSAGSYEDWRADASQFPAAALGNNLDGWPGERWLDVRNAGVRDIMAKRLDMAKAKGCDGVDPDNVDGYSNRTGFPLTAQDQINYNTFLADQAHARGMIVGLKNSTDLVTSLVNKFDFAVVEQCFAYNECQAYSPFIQQNKAVLNAEYSAYSSSICTQAKSLNFSTVFYNLGLDGTKYNPCP